jgi:hypothetical protein
MHQLRPLPALATALIATCTLLPRDAAAAVIAWQSGVAMDDTAVSNGGILIEAANFGNTATTAPTVNGVPFDAVDFTSGGTLTRLVGLTYNTGENGYLAGPGINQLYDTIAYHSGVDPQTATLTGLVSGTAYEVQFFYYHRNVNRSVTISGAEGGSVTLVESGEPVYAIGTFTADATTQGLTFDASTGSQFFNAYQLRTVSPPLVLGKVVISEFAASAEDSFDDGDGRSPDWIEIWNSTSNRADLSGWFLNGWPLPAITMEPGAYLVVFASGQDTNDYVDAGGFYHTDFKLPSDGGDLLLEKPDGGGGLEVADQYLAYPHQRTDITYGRYGDEAPLATGYLEMPTPGAANGTRGFDGFVADTKFDPDRGFFDGPFAITISSATSNATIRYTTDGSEPTEGNGSEYSGPIPVSATTVIRAAAFKTNMRPTNVDTHTYLFVDDVVDQPAEPTGFPTTWTGWDYAMEDDDTHIRLVAAGHTNMSVPEAKAIIADALKSLPSLSLTMSADDWFSPGSGIYHNSTSEGVTWERACSAEWLIPTNLPGHPFQIDCGVRIQGFTSRDPVRNPKHSLRLVFRGRYGDSKLRYPLLGDDGPDAFDTIVLRSNSQDAWVYNSSGNRVGQFIRDEWNRRLMQRLGQQVPLGTWVHLYLNGLYWGVYNPTERPDASFNESRFGGAKDNYDAIKNHEEVLDGTFDAYHDLLALIQNDPDDFNAGYRDLSTPAAYSNVLHYFELDMLADYMLHNMFAAANDWPGNFYMGYDRTGTHGGWRFFDWDNEHGLKDTAGIDRTGTHSRDKDSPTKFHHALRQNIEYRVRFGDRLHRAFFNDGPLTATNAAALWMELTGALETALIAESARWGDYRRSTPYTVHDDFQALRNSLLANWFPQRSANLLAQFRARGLYPSVVAPLFSHNGGEVSSHFELSMSAPTGTIHYTTDGADPRLPGGSVSTGAREYSGTPLSFTQGVTTVKARMLDGGEWSALQEALFLVDTEPARARNLALSEIHYNPKGTDDCEFLEMRNVGTRPVALGGARLLRAVDFSFGDILLGPGEYAVVVKDPVAFSNRYRNAASTYYHTPILVAGTWRGDLANEGETVRLLDRDGGVIQTFAYRTGGAWPGRADSRGASLQRARPDIPPDYPEHWRASCLHHGSPGRDDDRPTVVINELMTHSDTGVDWVELLNTGTNTVDISGWFLSDQLDDPFKYAIPTRAPLASSEFAVYTQDDFGQGSAAFSFSELGEEAALTEASGGELLRVIAYEDFAAAGRDIPFGRHLRWDGTAAFTALHSPTAASNNAPPLVGPVVIAEIMYHPPGGKPEYVELVNITSGSVPLYDPAYPSNTWKLVSAATYTFPTGVVIPAFDRVLLTETDPVSFRAAYDLPPTVAVYGPWEGQLDNDGESVRLRKPGSPEPDGTVPYVVADRVDYRDYSPWPAEPDGAGASLARLRYAAFGNDWRNWYASLPMSLLAPGDVRIENGRFVLNAIPGDRCRFEYRNSLATGDWILLEERVATNANEALYDGGSADAPHRFYRITWRH